VKGEPGKAASLVASIQKLNETLPRLKVVVVFQGGPELKEPLTRLAEEKKITIPMTFLPEGTGEAGYRAWKIHADAKNTVMVFNRRKVTANFVDVTDTSWAPVAKAAAALFE
jgi:hypothetical protein